MNCPITKQLPLLIIFLVSLTYGCQPKKITQQSAITSSGLNEGFADRNLDLALQQFDLLAQEALAVNRIPRTITKDNEYHWTSESFDWTEGFFPGTSWYFYELTNDIKWKNIAEKFQAQYESHKLKTSNHDLGFIFNCSYGNGYRLTQNDQFKKIMIAAGNSLITRFNPTIGCIQSWDVDKGWQAKRGWQFPVIVDNMMNLELLFELTKMTGDPKYREVALIHANTTMKNHFRPDNSSWHVIDYGVNNGEVRGKYTAQGYSDESSWARGQAWGLYGYVVCYRYTKNPIYLDQANKIADFIIENDKIEDDKIPYWDYDAPKIPNEPRDASAAAISASALLELSEYSDKKYLDYAADVLASLSSKAYLADKGTNNKFILKHSVGSIPHDNEIDVPLNYADYYYVEALMRYKNMRMSGGQTYSQKKNDFPEKIVLIDGHPEVENVSTYWLNYIESRQDGTDLYDIDSHIDPRYIPNNFSYAGYHQGDIPLPTEKELKSYRQFNVSDFGAIPDDQKSDKSAIKKTMTAIAEYQRNQGGGAIMYFPEGRFIINDAIDMQDIDPGNKEDIRMHQVIKLQASHIIIRGAGENKTTLWMKHALLPESPEKKWSTPYILQLGAPRSSSVVSSKILSSNGPGTTKSIVVEQPELFKVGDYVEIIGLIKDIDKIKAAVAPYELEFYADSKEYVWTNLTDGLDKIERHEIVKIEGNTLSFSTPIAHTIDAVDNWTANVINPAIEIGVENITIAGNWHDKFIHHKDAIHDSGFSLLQIGNATNSWMRNVKFKDFVRAVSWRKTFNLTAENITCTGVQGHSAFSIMYGNNNLTKNVQDQANAWHASGFSKYSISNVHLRMSYDPTSTSDLHGEQSMHNLFDNTDGGWVRHRWGAAHFNQPNHLHGLFYWNHNNTGESVENFEFMDSESKYGRLIMPHIVGLHGNRVTFQNQEYFAQKIQASKKADYIDLLPNAAQAHVEFSGKKVLPVSLYEAQLQYRQELNVKL